MLCFNTIIHLFSERLVKWFEIIVYTVPEISRITGSCNINTAGVQTGLHNGLNHFAFVQTSLHQIIKAALYHTGVESEEDCMIWDKAKVWSLRRAYCAILK